MQLEWARKLIERLNDHGLWITSFALYRIEKKKKELVVVRFHEPGEMIDGLTAQEWRERTEKAFLKIGWSVRKEISYRS